jgi:FkbM family methyltransferase
VADRNLLVGGGGFNRCVLGRQGFVLYNPNDIFIGGAIERYGEYCELEAQVLRQLCASGGVVVEVGANIGTHTQVLAERVGPTGFVFAYEAQRVVFQTLCANLALNSIVNVDARCAAVGADAGWVRIPDIDYTQRGNYGGLQVNACRSGKRVPMVRLDDDLEVGQLNLLKIDVEGMEIDVLRGAEGLIRRFLPVLYVENDRLDRSEALIRHIMGLGYRLYWHLSPLFNPANFFGETENLYPNLVSSNMLCAPRSWTLNVVGMPEITDPARHPMKPPG